jgi:hypothetical protein
MPKHPHQRLTAAGLLDPSGRLAEPHDPYVLALEDAVSRLLARYPADAVAALLDLHVLACRKAGGIIQKKRGPGAPKGPRRIEESLAIRRAILDETRRAILEGRQPNWRAVARDLKRSGRLIAAVGSINTRIFLEKKKMGDEDGAEAMNRATNALAALLRRSETPQ